jgi:hypothetical protein
VPRAREHDVGADREPEGVVTDDRYLDEHGNDRNDDQYERGHKPKVHCAFLLALRQNVQNLAGPAARQRTDLAASSKATCETTPETHGLTNLIPPSQCACALDGGAGGEIVVLVWTIDAAFYPLVRSRLLHVAAKRPSDSGIFESVLDR